MRPILLALTLLGTALSVSACESRHPGPYTDNSLGADIGRFGKETGRAFGNTTTGAMTTTNRAVGD